MKNILMNLKENHVNTVEYVHEKKRYKKLYSDVFHDVMCVCQYLQKLNIPKKSRIGCLCKNRYEFFLLDLACIHEGFVFMPLHYEIFRNKIQKAKKAYDLAIIFVDEEIKEQDSFIVSIVAIYNCISNENLNIDSVEIGFENDEDYTIILTSGSTGEPKGMNVKLKSPEHFIRTCVGKFSIMKNDKIIIFLPFSQFSSRCYYYSSILLKCNVCFSEPDKLMFDLLSYKPTMLQGVPYFFESIYESFMSKIRANELYLKEYNDFIQNKNNMSAQAIKESQKKLFGDFLQFWGGNMKYMITGSAPIRKEVIEFYNNAGITLYEAYGLIETGLITLNYPGNVKVGSVGKVLDDVEVLFDSNNQIFIRSEYVWGSSYINASTEDNEKMFQKDGTLVTGDIGYLDEDNFLYLQGRCKDLIVLSNGKKVSPAVLESQLNNAEMIKQSVVYGDNKAYLIAIVVRLNEKVTYRFIKEEIKRLNVSLAKEAQIKDFIIAKEPFSNENGLITSNMKLDRKKIIATYQEEINQLYKKE